MKKSLLLLPLLLAACGTPQEQCISRNTRDLRVVERLITEAEGNLKRGYAIERYEIRVPVTETCTRLVPTKDGPKQIVTTCRGWDTDTVARPKAIDLDAEAVKLKQLRAKQAELTRQAQSVVRQCQALYPET